MTVLTDFLSAAPPAGTRLENKDISGPDRFFNRELSWLAFNWRVLEEAQNPRVPLLERLRFLSISANNLDEFYTVRVAGLRELAETGKNMPAADGLTPVEQLVLINADARNLLERQQDVWSDLNAELATAGIALLTRDQLTGDEKAHLEQVFMSQVFPILSPLAIDPAHPFPLRSRTKGTRWRWNLSASPTTSPFARFCRSRTRSTVSCRCRPRQGTGSCRSKNFCFSISTGCSLATG